MIFPGVLSWDNSSLADFFWGCSLADFLVQLFLWPPKAWTPLATRRILEQLFNYHSFLYLALLNSPKTISKGNKKSRQRHKLKFHLTLLCKFFVCTSENSIYLASFSGRKIGKPHLPCKFFGRKIGKLDLLCKFFCRKIGKLNLPCKFFCREIGKPNLPCKFFGPKTRREGSLKS